MKAELLRRVRSRVKLEKRNNKYRVTTVKCIWGFPIGIEEGYWHCGEDFSFFMYREEIMRLARKIHGEPAKEVYHE